jgi:hypothetical protein
LLSHREKVGILAADTPPLTRIRILGACRASVISQCRRGAAGLEITTTGKSGLRSRNKVLLYRDGEEQKRTRKKGGKLPNPAVGTEKTLLHDIITYKHLRHLRATSDTTGLHWDARSVSSNSATVITRNVFEDAGDSLYTTNLAYCPVIVIILQSKAV